MRSAGFTLLEMLIVVVITAILGLAAGVGIQVAKKSAIETRMITISRAIVSAQEEYKRRFEVYAPDLSQLRGGETHTPPALGDVGAGDPQLAPGLDFFPEYVDVSYGYDDKFWYLTLAPAQPGITGDRSFYVDVTGVIRESAEGLATSSSTPID